MLVVHHAKKQKEVDQLNSASGSTAMTGVVDTYLLLSKPKRVEPDATLFCSGRDIAEREIKLRMDENHIWEVVDGASYSAIDVDHYVRCVALYLLFQTSILRRPSGYGNRLSANNKVVITASELAARANRFLDLTAKDELKPNMILKHLSHFHWQLESFAIRFETKQTKLERQLHFELIPERAKQLRFKRMELPREISLMMMQSVTSCCTTGDKVTGDNDIQTVSSCCCMAQIAEEKQKRLDAIKEKHRAEPEYQAVEPSTCQPVSGGEDDAG